MSRKCKQCGFSLITAIFVLVILASLAGYMISLSGVQGSIPVNAIQNARALNAARSATEWAQRIIASAPTSTLGCTNVNNATLNFSVNGLNNFNVNINCSLTNHVEGGTGNFNIINLVATAQFSNFGDTDYVERVTRTSLMLR